MENDVYTGILKPLIQDYSIIGILLVIIFVLIWNPEKTKIWKGWIEHFFSTVIRSWRKPAIKDRVEGNFNIAVKKVAKDLSNINMPKMSIQWVKEDDFISKLRDGTAIVNLKFSTDISENIVKVASIYVKHRVLPNAKHYMNKPLKSAIDLNIIRKILLSLEKDRDENLNTFFTENEKELNEVEDKSTQIHYVDNAGLFDRILVREYEYFGNKLKGLLPISEYAKEADDFLNYLLDIATRQYDDNTPLQFEGKILKVGVLLVAKIDTYSQYGLDAYLRRIKRGLVKGIKTFYLLAREDKVPLLEEVASKLLATGNFVLVNKPKEFLDNKNRSTICYCLRVDSSNAVAKAYERIANALDESVAIEGIVAKIRHDGIKVDVDGVEGFIRKANLSNSLIDDIKTYFKEGSSIEMIPIDRNADGVVEYTLIGTQNDPHVFIESNFTIGKIVEGEVRDFGDEVVYFNVGNNSISGSALRRNLTYSRFEFLHKLYPKGSKHNFSITEINFERNQVYLKLQNLSDPWSTLKLKEGRDVDVVICLKNERNFVGETKEGIEVVLPHKELAWLSKDIETKTREIKLNDTLNCRIICINKESRNLFVSLKEKASNPYLEYLQHNQNEKIEAILGKQDKNGICGIVDNQFNLFIPVSEFGWGKDTQTPEFKVNKKNIIKLIGVNKKNDCLIGSLKYKTEHPLKHFSVTYPIGYEFPKLKISEVYKWGAIMNVILKGKKYEILIFRGEIVNGCHIESTEAVFRDVVAIPVVIKEIDFDKQRIIGSLKMALNNASVNGITYNDSFEGIVAGENREGNYVVIVMEKWISGNLETTTRYPVGKIIKIRPSLLGDTVIFTEDE